MQLASSGGRRLRHAALAARKFALETERAVTRKELSASAREAERALQLSPPQRLVLSQLVACWGELDMARLLVWPSNQRLMAATGLSERAVRNAVRALIEHQLVIPKDSPNGKRYAVRDASDAIVDAFGFDLTPLFVRRGEWTAALAAQKHAKAELKRSFDEITICRRAAEEALGALERHHPAVDRSALESRLALLQTRTPKRSGAALPEGLLDAWKEIRQLAEEAFHQAGCGGTECRHIEPEKGSPGESCNKADPLDARAAARGETPARMRLAGLLAEACPVICGWTHPVRDAVDVIAAGRFLRASLGAHPSAWEEAVGEIGAIQAATAVIYVLQLHDDDVASGRNRIRNAGGYFRSIVRLIKEGRLDLQAELLALRRRKMT
ncbi:plasmid replication protein RepC [Microvirga subterranea]|uniref:Replication initiation protein RepC n=1 Tax=Microvirga subterranea TaxID=186651 RepID=A0A370HHV6_9HYPH|nr:plasmid replication protein RepC [Microvirga subterranea]RDI57778.1 replication initiation protein RepC [Microvirga subterranea]